MTVYVWYIFTDPADYRLKGTSRKVYDRRVKGA